MSSEKNKLLNRVRRMRGQLEGLQRALEEDASCTTLLQRATACRGALNSFIAEVIEDHIRDHIVIAMPEDSPSGHAADELIDIVHSYLK